jgi:hypothetical protein
MRGSTQAFFSFFGREHERGDGGTIGPFAAGSGDGHARAIAIRVPAAFQMGPRLNVRAPLRESGQPCP